MKLIDYIKAHGVAECAARFGVSEATIKAYRYGWRQPRPEVANRIVSVTGGEVTLAGIYAPPAPQQQGEAKDAA